MKGAEVPLRLDAAHMGPTGMYEELLMSSSGKSLVGHLLMLGLIGTTTPPKFIVSHISFIPRPLPPRLFAPQCLHTDTTGVLYRGGFFHNPVADLLFICQGICFTFTCYKHESAMALNFNEALLAFWGISVQWNASKWGESKEK